MDIISKLSTLGYAELSDVHNTEQALRATEMLGRLIPLNGQTVQKLVPKEKEVATSQSFSKRHGRDFFPLHTDTAFWTKPARFVILFSSTKSQTATRVLPLERTRELMAYARHTNPVFQRQTVSGPVYSQPWIDNIGCCALYDPCYMQPANHAAMEFAARTLQSATHAKRIVWTGASILIIDNWRLLHGRDNCVDDSRILYRFYRGTEL